MSHFVYDIETYPNYFCFAGEHLHSDASVFFEISEYVDDTDAFFAFLDEMSAYEVTGVGFNSLGFDYPVVHHLMTNRPRVRGVEGARIAYEKAEMIIRSSERFAHMFWPDQRLFPQIDLYKLNHFDNVSKATSLKALQFTMRSSSVQDLPIEPGTRLTPEQAKRTGEYCRHDVHETKSFAKRNAAEIAFREGLVADFGPEALNWSDVKIGAEYLIRRLPWNLCYYKDERGKRQPRQTPRASIDVGEIVFPYIYFKTRECQELSARFKATRITNTKSGVSDSIELNGFVLDYGTGGVHGSVDRRVFRASDTHMILDADVTSLYPSIAIVNNLYPEHLGETFTREYAALKAERQLHAKGTPENAALKLALNGTYGNSNNPYSPFYDPRYTMATTINGQLLLTMFIEALTFIRGVEIIQANTDGVTLYLPRDAKQYVDAVCEEWQRFTCLDLEYAEYSAFFCRDVNNYLAVDTNGKVKAKGAYWFPKTDDEYNGWWHRDYSAQIVQRAVQAALIDGADVDAFIREWKDPFDFMCRYKTPRTSRLMWGDDQQQRMTRYYVAKEGHPLVKLSPPPEHEWATPGAYKRRSGLDDGEFLRIWRTLEPGVWDERIHTKNKSVYDDRQISVCSCADICNVATDFKFENCDFEWYISEARKLIDCFN